MPALQPPESLPLAFREIWVALADAQRSARSRQELARRLRVSTGTLQRILVSGDVPDFEAAGARVTRAWARTITRLAIAVGRDARSWIEMVGIPWNETIAEVCSAEKEKIATTHRRVGEDDLQRAIGQVFTDAVVRHLELAAPSDGSRPLDDSVMEAVSRLLGGGGDGESGAHSAAEGAAECEHEVDRQRAHCRSCLADLRLDENRGASDWYCRYCADPTGRLRPRDEVHQILSMWLSELQGGLPAEKASLRAKHYMLAMPAWAKDKH